MIKESELVVLLSEEAPASERSLDRVERRTSAARRAFVEA